MVHEEIMQARIKIAKTPTLTITTKEVDDILSKLCMTAPQKAIDCFGEAISKSVK